MSYKISESSGFFKSARENARTDLSASSGEVPWEIYDSKFEDGDDSYSKVFDMVVPDSANGKQRNMKEFFVEEYGDKKGKLILVDVGGPGSNLAREINKIDDSVGFLARSLGVVLKDKRSKEGKRSDQQTRHSVLQADAFSKKGFNYSNLEVKHKILGTDAVREWLGKDKIDILFEKMHGAWNDVQFQNNSLYLVLNNWYKLMEENGTMFVQAPKIEDNNSLSIFLNWCDTVNDKYTGLVKVEYQIGEYNRYTLSLRKLKGAPTELPKL
jgi:hypothetical protein